MSNENKDIEALRKRIYDFVIRVVNLVKELPNNLIGNRIGGQLLDAGTSIGANFEEASAAFSKADFKDALADRPADDTREVIIGAQVLIRLRLMILNRDLEESVTPDGVGHPKISDLLPLAKWSESISMFIPLWFPDREKFVPYCFPMPIVR